LLNPVSVTAEGLRLVAGLHRLEACKKLGWEKIPVVLVSLDELMAELAEIDENLIRNELTELEQSLQLVRRKEIYEALHQHTKHGGAPRVGRGKGKKPKGDYKEANIASFQKDTTRGTSLQEKRLEER
jgi:ParB family chromosome partitioning protein